MARYSPPKSWYYLKKQHARRQGVGVSYEAEATALFARFSTEPDATRKGHINTLVKALKAAGVWSKLDALYVMAAHDAQAARRNWIADLYNLTAVSGPTFTTDRGYAGDGSASYLDTNFNPISAGSPKFTQNSAHLSAWNRTARAADLATVAIGARQSTTNYAEIAPRFTGDFLVGRMNMSGAIAATYSNANSNGHLVANRSAAAAMQAYRNGSSLGTRSETSATPPNSNVTLLARSLAGGSPDSFTTDQLAAASIGASLTAGEATAFYSAILAYNQAVGAA